MSKAPGDFTFGGYIPSGNALEEFEVVQQIGEGSFGVVQQIKRKTDRYGIQAAVKCIPIEPLVQQYGSLEALLRVPVMWNDLNRRGFFKDTDTTHNVELYDVRWSDNYFFIFLRLMSGGDLFSRIIDAPEGHLSEDEAKDVARSLLTAVAHTHAFGLIHRDVKSENVLLPTPHSPLRDLQLGDYGLAHQVEDENTTATSFAGSPGYISPEMARGEPYTMSTDVFSCGVILYECLSGRSPYTSHSPEDLVREAATKQVPYPTRYWKHVSVEARNFLWWLLHPDPSQRMSAKQALQHPWLHGRKLQPGWDSDETTSDYSSSDDLSLPSPRMTRRMTSLSSGFPTAPLGARPTGGRPTTIALDDIVYGRVSQADASKLASMNV